MPNIRAACFNGADAGLCMLKVHDTPAHDCGNTQLIGCFVSCFASDQRSVKVILSGEESSQLHTTHPTASATVLLHEERKHGDARISNLEFPVSL